MINKLQFRAFIIEKINGKFIGKVKYKTIENIPSESLLIKVSYSSLNYKDALSSVGSKGITNNYPHTPGIDAVGTVVECNNNQFKKGEKVIVTGYDLGMNTDGGFAEYIQVPSSWAIQLPENLSEKEAAIYGTAGLTAGMSTFYLTKNIDIDNDKPVVVSGASGGVGSISISILNKLGYKVAAITGKEYEKEFLLNLGANEIISINEIEKNSTSKPLLKSLFSGAIDTVGGNVLEYIIKSTKPMGTVTCCGNAKSSELDLTVFPFILRGISLIGIDSQNCPLDFRQKIWQLISNEWKISSILNNYTEISLYELPETINLMLAGKVKGRTIVKL